MSSQQRALRQKPAKGSPRVSPAGVVEGLIILRGIVISRTRNAGNATNVVTCSVRVRAKAQPANM